jgi:hypothetical protein
VIYLDGTAKKVIDRFVEETKKGIKITERERIVTQINAFDLITGEFIARSMNIHDFIEEYRSVIVAGVGRDSNPLYHPTTDRKKIYHQKRKAASRMKSGLSRIWLPGRDSNPRPIG